LPSITKDSYLRSMAAIASVRQHGWFTFEFEAWLSG
jgi:hypothetical protein